MNYQLFKRNNMKKYLSLAMIGLSLMLSGCSKDDNNDPDTPQTEEWKESIRRFTNIEEVAYNAANGTIHIELSTI
ncbi:hypothetical protein NCY64_18070 [Phocaeicola vulgatus]|uniref:hypothetical protein n=1 Tax=Phocaeicola vulgatus TaxID=821 RepID=UPI002030F21B|nr:hypothetical protein [Phocaeicola vulgatus]MCM1766292.1 hypothetical protein [Phocaeicola vulgatus]